MNKKLITASILLVFAIYGCGNDVPVSDDYALPDNGKPVYYQSEDTATQMQEDNETSQSEAGQSKENNSEIRLEVNSNSNKVSFRLADGSGLIERYNGYTGDVSCSFKVESVKLDVEESEITENQYRINVSFAGEKISDSKGDDAERGLKYPVRILDSNGVVIDSQQYMSKNFLKVGDRLEDFGLDINFQFIDLKPGEYTVDIFQQPENYVELANKNTKYLNPERWYSLIALNKDTKDSSYDFDIEEKWIYEYSLRNMYIDDALILHNVFNMPYDLNKTKCEIIKNETSLVINDCYSDSYYYDMENPAELLSGVPEEAIPRKIRVSYSPGGSMIDGERPAVMVTFIYRKDENDKQHGSISFWSKKGVHLTQKEWDMVLSNAEKADADKSQLAVISD